jgi:hypothetical protein
LKKTNHLPCISWLQIVNAAMVILLSGCGTPKEHSFNDDFGQTYPTDPQYYIYDEDETHFRIEVELGTPTSGAERVIDVKAAASTIAAAECKRLGWPKWQLNYIQEQNHGWMRVVIVEVTLEKYLEPVFPQSGTNS